MHAFIFSIPTWNSDVRDKWIMVYYLHDKSLECQAIGAITMEYSITPDDLTDVEWKNLKAIVEVFGGKTTERIVQPRTISF